MTARTYAMSWQLDGGAREAGRVEVTEHGIDFDSPRHAERIRFAELTVIRLAHGVLRLERHSKPALIVASLDGPGALRELADRVAVAAHLPG
jgi:hypothetical protein